MEKKLQAKHIDDALVLAEIRRQNEERPHYCGAITWEIAERLGYPDKLVAAKLRGLLLRGIIDGCPCGCRGDWKIVEREEPGTCPA